jgi:carbamoyl-phosphate synthase large subunit
VPSISSGEYLPALLDLCRSEAVSLVVPTIDPELPVLAEAAAKFFADGTVVAVSEPEVVAIAADKVATHHWLRQAGLPTVDQWTPTTLPADLTFPVIVKPRFGSASQGVARAHCLDEVGFLTASGGPWVVQSVAPGEEHTIDVFVDGSGVLRCAVPRRRIEVRGGEVSKAVTVEDSSLSDLAAAVVAALPGARFVGNIQVFIDRSTGKMSVIEINARFGGGFPLSWRAGADFPRWMIEDLLGLPSSAAPDRWRPGLVMLRYDDAVFLDAAAVDLE